MMAIYKNHKNYKLMKHMDMLHTGKKEPKHEMKTPKN